MPISVHRNGCGKGNGDFALPKRIRKGRNEGGSQLSTSVTATTEESDDESPRKQSRFGDEYEESEILNMISAGAADMEEPNSSVLTTGSSTQPLPRPFLVLPRVDVSLESLLPHIKNAAKLKAPWLSAMFALALCHDIYSAVHHMSSCGVVLKWLALDQIFVTSSGHLVLCGLQGASFVGEPALDSTVGASATPSKSDSGTADSDLVDSASKKKAREGGIC